jgi:predicted nuclease of predicted toxin-antitoxin system
MKLLFDQNLSFRLCRQLFDVFPGSNQVRLLGLAEAGDREIWQHAKTNDFVVVSQDADFAEMATLYGPPPKVIWLRCGKQPTEAIERRLREHAEAIAAFVQATQSPAGKSIEAEIQQGIKART